MPTVAPSGISGVDWHRHGGCERAWQQPRDWAQRDQPAFFAKLAAAENELVGLEKTGVPPHDERSRSARYAVARYYDQLNRLHDQHIKSLPFVRY